MTAFNVVRFRVASAPSLSITMFYNELHLSDCKPDALRISAAALSGDESSRPVVGTRSAPGRVGRIRSDKVARF
jgi:hypothetical protein